MRFTGEVGLLPPALGLNSGFWGFRALGSIGFKASEVKGLRGLGMFRGV